MKTCNIKGCNNPIWSKGVCKNHTPKFPLKKSCPIPKRKTGLDRTVKDVFKDTEKRDQFFMGIWITRMHRCEICGASLGHEPRSYMFDHILEKNKYEELEFEEDNIALVCLECHDNKNRGHINATYQEKINFVITKFNVS